MRIVLATILLATSLVGRLEAAPLTPAQAATSRQQEVEMQGTVYAVTAVGRDYDTRNIYMSFGDAYPRQILSVEYINGKIAGAKDLPVLNKREVLVKGMVEDGVHGPRIILREASQLQVLPVDEAAVLNNPSDTRRDRMMYATAWKQILARGEFGRIEKEAKRMKTEQPKFLDGLQMENDFYEGLSKPDNTSQENWATLLDTLDKWEKAYPSSATPRIAHGLALYNYVSDVRNKADSISETERQILRNRYIQAHGILTSIPKSDRVPPVYEKLISNVAGENANAEAEALLEECSRMWPDCYKVYFVAAGRLSSTSGEGNPGDWETLLDKATKQDTPQHLELYARVVWAQSELYDNVFKEAKVDWPRTKLGFEEIRRKYPQSWWNLNAYAKIAGIAGDKETSYQIAKNLYGHENMDYWVSWSNYQHFMDWVNSLDDVPTPKPGR